MEENQESVTQVTDSSATTEAKKDVVAYDTYRRTVGEVKALKSKLAELEAEREAERQAKLSEQGKYKEQAEELLKKLAEKDQQVKKVVTTFGRKVFEQEAKSLALGLGARQDALDDILKVGNFSDVEAEIDPDNNFSINKDQLKLKLEELAKTKPFYFQKTTEPVKDLIPNSKVTSGNKSIKDMSLEELRELAKQIK